MSENSSAPAGWYPDPAQEAGERWWDGTAWSQHARPAPPAAAPSASDTAGAPPSAPAASAPPVLPPYATVRTRRELPAETSVTTPWIWIVTVAPFVAMIPLFFVDMETLLLRSMTDPQYGSVALFLDPAYLATTVLGWLLYAAAVVCSWLDWRVLKSRGVERPFHWAWAFLSNAVYVIGRSVIVGKVAQGRGRAPMWVVIALVAVSFVAAIAWTVWVVGLTFQIATLYPGMVS